MKISAREKKFLFIGGGVAIAMIVYYLASALIPSSEGLSATVEFNKRLLAKQKETLGQEEAYRARIADYEQRLAQDRNRLLPGETVATAEAALQKVLSEFADQTQVEITSRNVQPEQKLQDNLTKISVQLNVSCSIDELVRFLSAVESYDKFLRVEEMYIQWARIRNREEIRPQLKVAGYIATPASETKPAEKPADKGGTGH